MANPFRRADRHGAPSIRPTPPESAETPMQDPIEAGALPAETRDLPVDRPVAPPSAETPVEPPPEPPPSSETPMEPLPAPPPPAADTPAERLGDKRAVNTGLTKSTTTIAGT